MTNKEIAKEILKNVGGNGNISNATHCATRLRLNLTDEKKMSIDGLEKIDGVIKAQMSNGQLQVVLGGKVTGVYAEFSEMLETGKQGKTDSAQEKKKFGLNRLIETISGIFSPVLPILVGCGMVQSLTAIISTFGLVQPDSGFFLVLKMTGDLIFYFMPFFLAVSAAQKFKTSIYLSVALAGAYMYPTIMNGAAEAASTGVRFLDFLGLPILYVNYKSTVIPIIISVWILSYVHRFIDRHVPEMFKIILTSMLTLLIMVPFELILIGPVGSYLGMYIAQGVKILYTSFGFIGAFLLGAFRPVLVMFGMHYAITPIMVQELSETGKTIIIPALLAGNLAQSGAAFATFILIKDKKEKSGAFSAALSALFGITEPAMYGYNLKYKKPFYAALFAAGTAAAYMSVFHAYSIAAALPGILSLPTYNADSFIYIITGVLIAVIGAFVLTLILGIDNNSKLNLFKRK
ncbi:PTS transporter subunit EIIC [Sebaldella sp. S0638]|uniref:PTS transporter subunit EIIC n=1 Tax=Sebaldella sp. S0638 TaxID=2957809 RepID=UPI0020A1465D|nr:PTS transporter subunit EIIC [Sebaldella sp. S0638]MCP1223617.1 PTS transporter subunit EIIC [Sebaldella sp. S0638]